MSKLAKAMQAAAGNAGGDKLYVEDVFSTYLYTGNGSTQTIENGIALGDFGVGTSTEFDGTNDYLTKFFTAGTFGAGTKTITLSAWFYWSGNVSQTIFQTPTFIAQIISPANTLAISAYSNTYSTILEASLINSVSKNTWNHILISIDLNNSSNRHVYINDISAAIGYSTYTNSSIGFDVAGTATVSSASAKFKGRLAGVYLDYTYRDLSVEANRRYFIDANGGSTAPSTLSALNPILYFPMTEDYSVGENLGTNGNFTVNGSPTIVQSGTQYEEGYGEGGLVWTKIRTSPGLHSVADTERGAANALVTYSSDGSVDRGTTGVTSFLSNGFSIGTGGFINSDTAPYASWTFRKAPKFFDVVTYTGDGASSQAISHNLGSTPGCVIVKRTDSTSFWLVWHRGFSSPDVSYGYLNSTDPFQPDSPNNNWGAAPTSTTITPNSNYNVSGATYVAYLFAHDAGGFGDDGEQNVISCGSYTGNGSTNGPEIDLGFEPQWLLIKRSDFLSDGWVIVDNMRGLIVDGSDQTLYANAADAEASVTVANLSATGFQIKNAWGGINASGGTYIYIAIRRPMKTPESGTEVFAPVARTGTGVAASISSLSFPPDAVITRNRTSNGSSRYAFYDKLRGSTRYLDTAATDSEFTVAESLTSFNQDGESFGTGAISNFSGDPYINWNFRRAPGFLEVLAYTGNGPGTQVINHNLGVAPELSIFKARSGTGGWTVYNGATQFLRLNETTAGATDGNISPTSTTVTVSSSLGFGFNASGVTYVAYLFASCPGVSKVGSYTGTGTTLAIDCGFSAGARFVLIKRTNSTGDWYVWDTTRGIVSGNDPYLLLNSSAAEVTSTDYIDPSSAGFEISSTAPAAINASGGSYIFLAIA